MRAADTKRLIPTFLAGLIIVLLIVGMVFYSSSITNRLSESTNNTLSEVLQQQSYNFTSKMQSELMYIKGISGVLAHSSDISEITPEIIAEATKNSSFDYVTVAGHNGNAINNAGIKTNVADYEFFRKAIDGETIISEPFPSMIRDATIVALASPLYFEGHIIGVIFGTYDIHKLDDLFQSSFGNMGYAYVVNNDGKIIARTTNSNAITQSDNYFETLARCTFTDGDDFRTLKAKVYLNQPGTTTYNYNGRQRLAHYMSLPINGWNIFSIVPMDVISKNATFITHSTTVLTLAFSVVFALLLLWNIRSQRQSFKKITDLAFTDELTNAPNFAKFRHDMEKMLEQRNRRNYIIVKLDIARFKLINQVFDYGVGDEIIRGVAGALGEMIDDKTCSYGRINADEFILLDTFEVDSQIEQRLQEFEQRMKERSQFLETCKLEFRYGRYVIGADDSDINAVLEKVNIAHRAAKNKTGKSICDYNESLRDELVKDVEIENKMERALEKNEFKVFLQPKYALIGETIAGAEALVRWQDGTSFISPGAFIPLFERNGFIAKLDMYIFERVCEIINKWMNMGIQPVTVSVNFSRYHLNNPYFVSELCNLADRYGVPHEYLEIELTETAIFDNEELIINVLSNLHNVGFTLSMDDFGTGYSSLGLLKNLPIDVVKMDRGFFMDNYDLTRAKIVLSNVMRMAKELGIHTVAEGVETKENIDLLRELGCDMVQGYYYARPMPEYELTERLM